MNKNSFSYLYKSDIHRYGGGGKLYHHLFSWTFRKCQTCNIRPLYFLYRFFFMIVKSLKHVEIYGKCDIGPGLYMNHIYGITINMNAKIGKNCNLHKGVTIGMENRGIRKGYPTIGDEVWIGVNSTIVGKITIGDDVLIAPNSYVNCDVPSHSIVFGNPCVIKRRENATESYINNKI